ncbi:MAG: RnfABCDGE type electron transport complex subunit D [Crocinitomicaceae bacterium]|nr:RnfABCDGE type electron transport complex subunit D [Crocinitomicaceae bacterium]
MSQVATTDSSIIGSIVEGFKKVTQDARHFQIAYLSLFLGYGIMKLNWEILPIEIFIILSTSVLTQFIWLKITGGKMSGLKSALITGLGICLILHSDSILTLSVAAVISISSKFLIKIKNKHLFNPNNFGIIISILIFQDAWISPGQWGSDAMFLFGISILGGFILFKVNRLETGLVFLGTLFALEYLRTVAYQGWEMDVLMHKFSSGTLLLFSFFMITDPMTTPNSRRSRIIWSIVLAGLTFFLSNWIQLYTAPIWVLFFMAPLTVLLDKIYPAKKFEWIKEKESPNNQISINN